MFFPFIESRSNSYISVLTLDVGESLLDELLLERGLGELSVNGGLNGLDEGSLFRLSLLLLVSNPRVKNLLDLSLDGVLLLEGEVLVLELVDLLGDGVQALSDRDDLLHLVDGVDSLSDGLGVFLSRTGKDTLDSVNVTVGPGRVRGTNGSSDGSEDDEESNGEDSLLVGDVELGGDGGSGHTSTEDDTTGLGEERGLRDSVDDRRSLLLRGRGLLGSHTSGGHDPSGRGGDNGGSGESCERGGRGV